MKYTALSNGSAIPHYDRRGRKYMYLLFTRDVIEGQGFEWEILPQSWPGNINFDASEGIICEAESNEQPP